MLIVVRGWLTTEVIMINDANRSKQSEPPWPSRQDRPDVRQSLSDHFRRMHERADEDEGEVSEKNRKPDTTGLPTR